MDPARNVQGELDLTPGIREQPGSLAEVTAAPAMSVLHPEADITAK